MVAAEVEHIVVDQQAAMTAADQEEDNLDQTTLVLAHLVVRAEQQIMEVFQFLHLEILAEIIAIILVVAVVERAVAAVVLDPAVLAVKITLQELM
jgi:hypothetical protein